LLYRKQQALSFPDAHVRLRPNSNLTGQRDRLQLRGGAFWIRTWRRHSWPRPEEMESTTSRSPHSGSDGPRRVARCGRRTRGSLGTLLQADARPVRWRPDLV